MNAREAQRMHDRSAAQERWIQRVDDNADQNPRVARANGKMCQPRERAMAHDDRNPEQRKHHAEHLPQTGTFAK